MRDIETETQPDIVEAAEVNIVDVVDIVRVPIFLPRMVVGAGAGDGDRSCNDEVNICHEMSRRVTLSRTRSSHQTKSVLEEAFTF